MAFTQDSNELIKLAFGKVGISDPSGTQLDEGRDWLNIEVNALPTEGLLLWQTNENSYSLTASSIVKKAALSKSYRCTKGNTSSANDEPGVASGAVEFWIEIAFDATHTEWASVTTYTSVNEVVLDNAVIDIDKLTVRTEGNIDYRVEIITYREFMALDLKYTEDRPTHAYLQRDGAITTGNTTNKLRFFPHFNNLNDIILSREIINITETETNADLPDIIKRFYKLFIFAIAHQLADKYDPDKKRSLFNQYELEKKRQLGRYTETDDRAFVDGYFYDSNNTILNNRISRNFRGI